MPDPLQSSTYLPYFKSFNFLGEKPLIIKTLAVGPIMANCFIVGCKNTKSAVVIDPGDEADKILMALAESQLTVKEIT